MFCSCKEYGKPHCFVGIFFIFFLEAVSAGFKIVVMMFL